MHGPKAIEWQKSGSLAWRLVPPELRTDAQAAQTAQDFRLDAAEDGKQSGNRKCSGSGLRGFRYALHTMHFLQKMKRNLSCASYPLCDEM